MSHPFPAQVTLQAFCKTMLSEDILGWTLEGHEARGDVAHYVAREVSFGSNVVGEHMLYNIPMSPLLPRVRRLAESCAAVRSQVFLPLLRRRRAAMDEGQAPDDCLTALLAAQEGFSDDELMDQLVTLIGAGHDTSAYFCCYAALLLAKHPTWQRRLRDELRGDDLDWQASLLKRVVMEVLRLFPVIPMVTRACARATDLPDDTGATKRVPRGARHACASEASASPSSSLEGGRARAARRTSNRCGSSRYISTVACANPLRQAQLYFRFLFSWGNMCM